MNTSVRRSAVVVLLMLSAAAGVRSHFANWNESAPSCSLADSA